SRVERMPASLFLAARTRRLAKKISIDLASHTVQVTTDARARPIRTAFTTGSALRNMPQGLRSRGSSAFATTLSCARAERGAPSHAINAAHGTAPLSVATLHRARGTPIFPLCLCFISTTLIHHHLLGRQTAIPRPVVISVGPHGLQSWARRRCSQESSGI